MGMLRVKVGTAWIDIPAGPPGPGVPLGGVLGSLLMKNSAGDYDTAWATTLTAPLTMTKPLTITTDTSGGGPGSTNLTLAPSNSVNEGGQITFAGFAGYNTAMYLDRFADAFRFVWGGVVIGGFVGQGYGFNIGTHPVHGTGYSAIWRPTVAGGGDYTILSDGAGNTWLNASSGQSILFHINNTNRMRIPPTGDLLFGAGMDGITFGYGPRIYTADATWVRSAYLYGAQEVRGGVLSSETYIYVNAYQPIRLYSGSDNNHRLQYDSATPNQAGEASNGPRLNGYSSVWLHQEVQDKSLYLGAGGNAFLNAGNAYQNFSSRQFKENIETLDPAECLAMVMCWRPVRFDWKADQNTPYPIGEGFISEEMHETTPNLVNVTRSDDVVPNWPNAINYSGTAPWLTGAVQYLAARIHELEQRLEAA